MVNPYKDCILEVIQYARLVDGWGDYKSRGIAPDNILRMIRLVDAVEKFFGCRDLELTPCPLGDGGTCLEIGFGNRKLHVTFWGESYKFETEVVRESEGKFYPPQNNFVSIDPHLKWLADAETRVVVRYAGSDKTLVPNPDSPH